MSLFPTIRTWADNSRIKNLGDFPFYIGIYPAYQMQPHRHEYLELSLIIEGNNRQIINGKEYIMKPGTLTFLLPYQVHEMPYSSNRVMLYNCMFDLQFLFRSSGVKTGLNELLFLQNELPPSIHLEGTEMEKFKALMEELLEEQKESYLWKNDLLQLKLMEILIRFDRLRRQALPGNNSDDISNTQTIWAVIHYIHTHYRDPLSLSSLSESFGISKSYLSAEFKRHTGLNFVAFLHEVRIRHACSLLVASDMSGIDIAIEVGFSCFKTFSRIFRELKGVSPREFRRVDENTRSQVRVN
jgi:AraC-like DNA-binding protein